MAAAAAFALVATPGVALGQDDARRDMSAEGQANAQDFGGRLDALATERAQDLNQAYYEYEQELEEARQEAQRQNQPNYFSERREELRENLERRVLQIERRYEKQRADLLQEQTGQRWEGGEVEDRFAQSAALRRSARTKIAQLNTQLAQAWADFHEAADELRARKAADRDWDGYEDALSALEQEYQETISNIQQRQRELRFEIARMETPPGDADMNVSVDADDYDDD